MRILKLETMNLASLEGENVIPFEEGLLRDSQIFSIVGPTGSGKSTLLDAICLALYGLAPRYPLRKGEKRKRIEIIGESDEDENNRLSPLDARNILSRGRKFGYSRLTFQANDGKTYRAEWNVTFKLKKYGNAEKRLFQLDTDADGKCVEHECDWAMLEGIIGLDFDQFLRTVLIAQGSFANFLSASETDRYQLLEKLVGNEHVYSRIAAEIAESKRAAESAYMEVRARCEAFEKDLLSAEELDALNQKIEELETWEKHINEELKQTEESLKWYADEEQQTEALARHKIACSEALSALQAMKVAIGRLALHDETLEAVRLYTDEQAKWRERGDLSEQRQKVVEDIKQKANQLEMEAQLLKELQAKSALVNERMERMAPRIKAARALRVELDNAMKNESEKSKALEENRQLASKAKQEVEANSRAIAETRQKVETATNQLQDMKLETAKREAELRNLLENAETNLEKSEKELKSIDFEDLQNRKTLTDADLQDLEKAIDNQQTLAKKKEDEQSKRKSLDEQERRKKDLEASLENLVTDALEKEVETLTASVTLMSSENWGLHRHQLFEGQPCPLCGAVHHPYADDEVVAPVLREMDILLREKKTALSQIVEQRNSITQQVATISGQKKELEKSILTLCAEIEDYGRKWALLSHEHPSWSSDVNALKAMRPDFQEKKRLADEALKDYQKKSRGVDDLRRQKDKAAKELNDYKEKVGKQVEEASEKLKELQMTLLSHQAKTSNLQQQSEEKHQSMELAQTKYEESRDARRKSQEAYEQALDGRNPDDVEAELADEKKKSDESVHQREQALAEMRSEKGKLEGRLETLRNQVETLEKDAENLKQQLGEWVFSYNQRKESRGEPQHEEPLTEQMIADLSCATDDWEAIRVDKSSKEAALIQAKTTCDNAEKAHQDHLQVKPSKERDQLIAFKMELAGKSRQQELVESKARLQRYTNACQELGSLTEQLEAARLLLDDWKAIYVAVGGNAEGRDLRKIVQCYTLRFLVTHANAEIAKFNSRYELVQVKNSLGLRVIDHDRGNDVRDTTSLSGGETFIVSLGLALGLSSLSSRNISFANLFIDEGFGTLDADTLSTVIDALSMLQTAQGKKVCVISHTDTMSERITTQIRVTKQGDTGISHIEIVGG